MRPGVFVSFEGVDGCGKSTQIRALEERLASLGVACLATREPGGTSLGEAVRHLLQHAPEGAGMCPETELLLFAASRAQLVRERIRPALEAGLWVLADRFHDSSVVYQGAARGLGIEAVRGINAFALGGCLPDVTFILDMDVAEARRRAREATRSAGLRDRMEDEDAAFFETVRQGYLDLAAREPARVAVVPADRDAVSVQADIWNLLTLRFDGLPD
jgi:dTMP kinase